MSYEGPETRNQASSGRIVGNKGGGHTGGMTIGIVAAAVVFWSAAPLLLIDAWKGYYFS
jgi:hypothetical protein